MWPIERAKTGASRVVIAACPLGLGTHELFPVASPLWSRIARRLTHLRLADLERPWEKVRTVVKLLQQKQQHMMALSPGLKPHDLTAMFPHAQWYGEWATLKAALLARHGEGHVTVAVYRCAPFLIPSGALEPQAIKAGSRHPQRLTAST